MSNKSALKVDSLRKSFGSDLVLDSVSFDVPEGSATVLIGASGSGKSTLLRCINLLEQIDDGAIFLDEEEITNPEIDIDQTRRKIAMVFQAFNLFPHKTVRENITLAPVIVHRLT
ncbi:MAG: amino acid ABC transporter ATP-binding protein, partial [Actinobacteria bacterium]|nr:amino acid ABC transporter ATP-binding protein [Actinomycetota bacterium]